MGAGRHIHFEVYVAESFRRYLAVLALIGQLLSECMLTHSELSSCIMP